MIKYSPKIFLFLSWIAWIPSIERHVLHLYSHYCLSLSLSLHHWNPIKRLRASSEFFLPKIFLFLSWIAWIPSIERQFLHLYSHYCLSLSLSLSLFTIEIRSNSYAPLQNSSPSFVNRLNPISLTSVECFSIRPDQYFSRTFFTYVRTYVSRYLCHEERPGRVGQDGSDVNRPAA